MTRLATVINKIIDIINTKQPTLVSGENIKKLNGTDIVGSGNIPVKTVGGESILGDGNVGVKTINGETMIGSGDAEIVGTGTLSTTAQSIIGAINELDTDKAEQSDLTALTGRVGTAETDIVALDGRVTQAEAAVGTPLVASTVAGMTDQTKIYVYTGSETGYTSGNWYYWNGTAWTSGGVYNSTAFETDATLAVSGMAADAKVVGDELTDVKSDISETDNALGGIAKIKHKIDYISGYYIYVGNDIGTTTSIDPLVDANYEYAIISCSEGDTINVNAKGAIGTRAWAFLDSDNKLLSRSASGIIEETILAPQNAAKCVLNNKKSDYVNNSQNILGKDNFAIASQAIDEASEYVIQNVELTRGYYSYSGVPSHKTFTSLDYYESASVNCAEGEKYSISGYVLNNTADIGFFWDENDNLISSIGTSSTNEYTDKSITIPDGCVNFTVTSYRNQSKTYTVVKKWSIVGVKSESEKHLLIGKKFISFGDSITASDWRWRSQFIKETGATEIHCYAVGGATLVDWEDTVLDGNIQDGAQNTVCNQVAQFLLDPPDDVPDFVVISAGTNDSWSADDLTRTTNTQFVDNNNSWISLDDVDRMRPDGAMRWQAEKIWSVYPDTIIVFGAPIQCAESIHRFRLQQQKNDRMKIVGDQLSCKVIMGAYDSGIYGRYETANVNGKYLADGIHPNTDGGVVLGKLYAREICSLLRF